MSVGKVTVGEKSVLEVSVGDVPIGEMSVGELFGHPILGSVLFNIFRCHMFLFQYEAQYTGYEDDKTPFLVRGNATKVKSA